MRTPLLLVIFFLKQIIHILNLDQPIQPLKFEQATKYGNLMMSQLHFVQSFVDDLLDMKQMEAGVFTLASHQFDIRQVFQSISSIFDPQARAQGVQISYSFDHDLELPEEETLHANHHKIKLLSSVRSVKYSAIPEKLMGDERRLK